MEEPTITSREQPEAAPTSPPAFDLLSPDVRKALLTERRTRVAFSVLTLGLVATLSLATIFSIDRVFDWLTPLADRDLQWKTERGLVELGRTADVGILLRDPKLIQVAVQDYERDTEVRSIVAQDPRGETLYKHQKGGPLEEELFRGSPGRAYGGATSRRGWASLTIEGQQVGRLGLAVSTDRLRAGAVLRMQVLWATLGVGLLAMLLSYVFVRIYVTPLLRVTTRALVDLERRTAEALEASRIKSRFLANVSHELRTPLNGILGMTGLLLRGDLTSPQRRQAQIVENASQHLLRLISDLLDFSKLEAGRVRLNPVACELRELVQTRVELLSVNVHAKRLEIACRIADDVPRTLRLDPDRLTQVLTNLVGNALKFTATGEIEVSVDVCTKSPDGSEVELGFEVRDTGPGIEREAQTKLFRSFSQVDASASRAFEGTGLGLVISKHLVELMGGQIGVESEPGVGSTFWFRLRCEVVEAAWRDELSERARGTRVLFVDPSPMYRRILCEYADSWQLRAEAAADLHEALQLAARARERGEPFDTLVIDVRASSKEGASPSQQLCATLGPALRTVYLTPPWASALAELPAEACVVLAKPLRVGELLDCLAAGASARVRKRRLPEGREAPSIRAHVLVVDDNEVSRVLAQEILRELGHSCDLASGGAEAVERADSHSYDAILMDCQMPEVSGYQAARTIRAHETGQGRHTPIIALTAHAMAEEEDRVREAGMDALLTKPLSFEALEAMLQRWAKPKPSSREFPPLLVAHRRSRQILEIFLHTVPDQIEDLTQAQQRGDLAEVRARAHRLRGSAASIGAERMATGCAAVEAALERGDTGQVPAQIAQIVRDFPLLRERLQAELHPT